MWLECWGFEQDRAAGVEFNHMRWIILPVKSMQWNTSIKSTLKLSAASWCVNSLVCQVGDLTWFHGEWAFGTLPDLILYVSSFGWSSFVSFVIKLIVSIELSWVVWVILTNYQTWGMSKNLPEVRVASEVRAVFLGTVLLNLWGLMLELHVVG